MQKMHLSDVYFLKKASSTGRKVCPGVPCTFWRGANVLLVSVAKCSKWRQEFLWMGPLRLISFSIAFISLLLLQLHVERSLCGTQFICITDYCFSFWWCPIILLIKSFILVHAYFWTVFSKLPWLDIWIYQYLFLSLLNNVGIVIPFPWW